MTEVKMVYNPLYHLIKTPYGKYYYPLNKRNGFPLMQFKYVRARDAEGHTRRNINKKKLRQKRYQERGKTYQEEVASRYKEYRKEEVRQQELQRAKESENESI